MDFVCVVFRSVFVVYLGSNLGFDMLSQAKPAIQVLEGSVFFHKKKRKKNHIQIGTTVRHDSNSPHVPVLSGQRESKKKVKQGIPLNNDFLK